MKQVHSIHRDVMTAPAYMKSLADGYSAEGYKVVNNVLNTFILEFQDGSVLFYWEAGTVYFEGFKAVA